MSQTKLRIAVEVVGAVDEMRGVEQRRDLRLAVLVLPAQVFGEGQAALGRIAGLAEIGRQRGEIVEGDVRRDIDEFGHQQFAQERHLHRLALEVVGDVFAHVAGADAVIDRVVEPVAARRAAGWTDGSCPGPTCRTAAPAARLPGGTPRPWGRSSPVPFAARPAPGRSVRSCNRP